MMKQQIKRNLKRQKLDQINFLSYFVIGFSIRFFMRNLWNLLKYYFTELKFEWTLLIILIVFIQVYVSIVPYIDYLLLPELENLILRLLKVLVFMNIGWISSYRLYRNVEDNKLQYTLRAVHTAALTIAGALVL